MMRRLLVPEVVQTSMMDCGPASLKALLEGFGVTVSYGRLREACQTDVDGTSIDRIEETALQLGLDARQEMAPVDHLLLAESNALPAMVVVQMPNGGTHFVVVWRRHGRWLQLMDPATGRRWTSNQRFLADVYVHTQAVPIAAWREWAASAAFLDPLRRRMQSLGIAGSQAGELTERALADGRWCPLAALDAATRMAAALLRCGGIARSSAVARLIEGLAANSAAIPAIYWSVKPDPSSPDNLLFVGAVLLHVSGTKARGEGLSTELSAALAEPPSRPGRDLLGMVCADGLAAPALLVAALALSAGSVVVEALLLRGLLDAGQNLVLSGQRIWAAGALLVFLVATLLLEAPLAAGLLRMGRRLECRLRLAFLRKIPRLSDRYFQSRLTSDMAARCHSAQYLRQAPELAARLLRPAFEMAFTVAGIAWLFPESALAATALAAISLAIPLAAQPLLAERDLRFRSHTGALTRFYLDALLGLTAIRSHGAERSVRREQESLLGEWARAGFGVQKAVTAMEGLQLFLSLALASWLVLSRLAHGGEAAGVLLLVYWALNLPALAQEAAAAAWQYPAQRNAALRLLEPLGAKEEEQVERPGYAAGERGDGVSITLERVAVRAAGHTILDEIDLYIEPGSQVAIVGPSGAGKSSLAGLLLGWHRAAEGRVLVNGEPLDGARLERLRSETAWVDPQVQLWNRSFFDNLRYGAACTTGIPAGVPCQSGPAPEVGQAVPPAGRILSRGLSMDATLEAADLHGVLKRLPDGLQTALGEGGALVSGGEGQRVRLGRAMSRSGARLVILDEPGRGLDRERRQALVDRAREMWKGATLLLITHDIADTRDFERVLVIERSRIVEDGCPAKLAASPNSRYRALLEAEYAVRSGMWRHPKWRRLRLDRGRLAEEQRKETACASI
jgi:ATP-binding cassette subfamily B protein